MAGARRQFLEGAAKAAGVALLVCPGLPAAREAGNGTPTISGIDQPALAPFDDVLSRIMGEQGIPGGQLAVSDNGRLVHARGFGWADRELRRAVTPTALFRIASVSKPITAVAILQLVERSKLSLDARACDVLQLAEPADSRWKRVTILHLLQHTGGWDRERSLDPMFESAGIAKALKVPPPAQPAQIIGYMLRQPLDFDPGSRFAYSNFGYCLLGRVIERISGATYEGHVQREVLAPLGIRRMRLGKTLAAQRADTEVSYYTDRDHQGQAAAGVTRAGVLLPYGAWSLEAMDAHGGWLASATDLVRFACAFDVPATCKILHPTSITTMFARPPGAPGHDTKGKPRAAYYACGWEVTSVGRSGQMNVWHTGSLDGTSALLVRRHDGKNWAVLFNARTSSDGRRLSQKVDPLIHQAADRVRRWPQGDQFGQLL